MNRRIDRNYYFSEREVNEIIVDHLKRVEVPRPQYVVTSKDCKWTRDASGGVRVEWTDTDEVDILQ